MFLTDQISLLATGIANYLRDSVKPRLLPAGGAPGQVLAKTAVDNYAASWTTPKTGRVYSFNIQTFTTSGTWTKPAGAVAVTVYMQGSGGGGASGGRQPFGTAVLGGYPGGAGGGAIVPLDPAILPAQVSVTIGLGGSGGAAITADAAVGNKGNNGGATSFGTVGSQIFAMGATGGRGAAVNAAGPNGWSVSGCGYTGNQATSLGGSPQAAGPGQGVYPYASPYMFALPGGPGASQPATPGNYNGASTESTLIGVYITTLGGAYANATNKTDPVSTTADYPFNYGITSYGGAGGWSNSDGTAGPGAAGRNGGGGGGGGAGLGSNPSGKGGDGGTGKIVVVTECVTDP